MAPRVSGPEGRLAFRWPGLFEGIFEGGGEEIKMAIIGSYQGASVHMDLKLFSVERTKYRAVVIVLLAIFFCYGVWQLFHYGVLNDWKDSVKFVGNGYWIIVDLVFPLIAAISIYLRNPEGLRILYLWILFSMCGLEIELVFYGPTFFFPGAWWTILLVSAFLFLIGVGDLWRSLVFRHPEGKSVTPLWFNKSFWILITLLLLGIPPSYFIFYGIKFGFSSPEFSIRPNENKVDTISNSVILPFGVQLNLPSPPEISWIDPKEGWLFFKIGKSLWTFDSTNFFQNGLKTLTKSPEKFLAERYGIDPRMIKSTFGEKPDYFFEIKQDGLWGAVSVREMDKKDAAVVQVYLWDDTDKPIGGITGFAASSSPQDWEWVYSIRRPGAPIWSADQYAEVAKKCLAQGQKNLAGFYLASAVIEDPDKATRLKSLIDFFQKQGLVEKAKYQLKAALEDYPQDPILKSIKLTGGE